MPSIPPDWQLPPGVDRDLWQYVHDPARARDYDAGLAGSALFAADQRFAERHFPRPGRLIDLGCGTGRLLLAFAARGYPVVGVDLSEDMLRVCAEKAARAGVAVDLVRANLPQLDALADASFDYAACLFSTLGMIVGAGPRRRVVEHAHRLLRPGGRLVLHVHNRWFNLRDPAGRRWLLRDLLGFGMGDRPVPPHQGSAGYTLHHFTRREAMRLLEGVGFRVVEVVPVSLRPDGRLPAPAWFGGLRAYGYLLAAERGGTDGKLRAS